jgi:Protein of unknown function (DUF3052)
MANTTGYSGTPLAKKLGMKDGCRLQLINAPESYFSLFVHLPAVELVDDEATPKDLIHFFTRSAEELQRLLPALQKQIRPDGMIWVSWPKKASKVPTDVTEDVIRNLALKQGLVDIKVCAVDETWSALKLVIPVKHRKT